MSLDYFDCPRIDAAFGNSKVSGGEVANSNRLVISEGAPDTLRISIQKIPCTGNRDYNLISIGTFSISGGVDADLPFHEFYLIPDQLIRGNTKFKTRIGSQSISGKQQAVVVHDSAHTIEVYTSGTTVAPQVCYGGVISLITEY